LGQTWLVWEDTEPTPDTYRIYSSLQEIDDLGQAVMVGRVFPEDWQAVRLKRVDPDLTWTVPDGASGLYQLASNEAVFVYTPHSPEPEYFAVVKDGSAVVGPENQIGPIHQSIDPVQCHLQASGSDNGHAYRIYAHWIDGRDDWDSGRPDYPVMGNEHFNGTAAVFRVWEPQGGRPPGLLPAVIALHGGGGVFARSSPTSSTGASTRLTLSDGLLIALDDPVLIRRDAGVRSAGTYWFGYWEGYDRFTLPDLQPVPDDGLIVDYTMRRVDWTLRWIVGKEGIDPNRVSITGASMGGRGTFYNTRHHPERYSAGAAFVPGLAPFEGDILLGSRSQNLRTSLPGSPTVEEAWHPAVVISDTERDMVYTQVIAGRNDQTGGAGWSAERVQQYHDLNDAGFGHHMYWDERGHGAWQGAHWHGSPRLLAQALTRYRRDQSFPAFVNDDQDPETPGRQPDVGDGDPAIGDPWGTWAGYYDWDLDTIEDTSSRWAATVYLVSSSSFDNDVPTFDSATADVAIRRPQQFMPPPLSEVEWTFVRLSDGSVLQSGMATVDAEGVVIVPNLTIYKTPCRLTVSEVRPRPAFTVAGVVNAASYAGGPVAPSEIITIFGAGIGPASLAGMERTPDGQYVSNLLADTRVLFDGTPAPLIYVFATQLSVVTPVSLAGRIATQVQIEYAGQLSDPVALPVAEAAPGIFTIPPIGHGQGAILHWPDYSLNDHTNPAAKGSVIMVFGTSGGLTQPAGEDGRLVTQAQFLQLPVTATIGGVPATVSYAGAAPNLVTGVLQVNITIPETAPSGEAVPLVISVAGVESQQGVTLAIR
jgi:uncharacterized protein (TIGR03437 family)